ncbi:MAG: hypothetical protein H6726_00325 [Sandaracinaceae bacterium]|nr:hypothetical protein [Sandaracinaceae bacterium]
MLTTRRTHGRGPLWSTLMTTVLTVHSAGCATSHPSAGQEPTARRDAATAEAPTPEGWRAAGVALERSAVHPSLGGRTTLRAYDRGLEVVAREFRVHVGLRSLGRSGTAADGSSASTSVEASATAPSIASVPSVGADAVVYARGAHDEFFRVAAGGIEHGVVVHAAPAGEGFLRAEVGFDGLRPTLREGRVWLLDEAGVERAAYDGLHAFDASGAALGTLLSVTDDGLVALDVDDVGARYPITIDPILWGTETITGSVAGCSAASSGFGAAVTVVGAQLAVGAPSACADGASTGAVVVFDRPGSTWLESAVLFRPGSAGGDAFGARITLTTDALIASAPGANAGAGAIEVFVRLGRRFHAVTTLALPPALDTTPGAALGMALAADEETIIAGAPGANGGAGGVAIYQRDQAGSWSTLQTLSVEGTTGFGQALALAPSFLLVVADDSVEVFDRRGPRDPFGSSTSLALDGVADVAASEQGFVAARGSSLRFIDYDPTLATWGLGATVAVADASDTQFVATQDSGLAVAGSAGAAFYLGAMDTYETDGTIAGSTTDSVALALDGQSLYVGDAGDRVLVHRRVASNGEACTAGAQCDSGFCVDGVCCNAACGLGEVDCLACSVSAGSAADGQCMTARAGSVCRPAVGNCDAAELCDGSSTQCRTDRLLPSGTTCRESAGPCDVAESCGGQSPFCPTDEFRSVGAVCRAKAGDCDVAEACNGFEAECPSDRVALAGRVCRPRDGACDVEEACDGVEPACPRDGYKRFGSVCRPPSNSCDAPERCTGTSNACPVNEAQPDGTACADGDACTEGDMCMAGQCISGPRMCMAPTPTPPMRSSSGCAVAQGDSGAPGVWGALLLALVALGRRRGKPLRATRRRQAAACAALTIALLASSGARAQDSDNDGVPDAMDVCPGGDDRIDFDVDGTPAFCDCDDGRASTRPGAPELCNGQDNDCDGYVDATFLSGGTPAELVANVGTRAVSSATTMIGSEVRWTTNYFQSGVVRYSEMLEHAPPGTAQSLSLIVQPSVLPTASLYGFFGGGRFIGVIVLFTPGQPTAVAIAQGSATDAPSGGIFGYPLGRFQGSIPAYSHFLPTGPIRLTLHVAADGTQSLSLTGANGNGVDVPLPATSYLSVAASWRLWIASSTGASAVQSAGVAVHATLDDEDHDTVCDARDVCADGSDLMDGDGDGIPDTCDACVGADGADNDSDGYPSPCDCDDSDPAIHPGAADVCDGVDNDCDGTSDVGTLMSAVGNDLLYRLASGQASGIAVSGTLPTFTSFDGGGAVRAAFPSAAGAWTVYYREDLTRNPTAGDPNRVRVVVDRDTRTGDHDFIVGLSDGNRVFGLQLGDVGGNGISYTAAPFVGVDGDTNITTPTFPDAERVDSRFAFSDASPYTLDFVFGADPRIEIRTADGARGLVRMTAGEVGAVNLDNLSLFLSANQTNETFVIRSIHASQAHVDSDEDTVCDALDRCPGLDDTGPDQDSDGIPDACDICTGGPDGLDDDGDGVPNACDACPSFPDQQDRDDDGLPDGCDVCPDDAANDFDRDGVCDMSDLCLLGPDSADADGDGIPDACDPCPVDGMGDSDEDGTCDAGDVCLGDDRRGDRDGDGFCADIDCDDTRASIHPGADEVCDGYDSNCDGVLPQRELDNNGNQRIDCREGSGCVADPTGASTTPWWFVALFATLTLGRRRRAPR